jgi:hypothetical protein
MGAAFAGKAVRGSLRSRYSFRFAAAAVFFCASANAEVFVRFVATYGNDANPCTRAAPCRSLQRGYDLTPTGGELQILDSGEYAVLSISRSITISAVGISATVSSSTAAAITIRRRRDQPDGPVVVLRGLHLRGQGENALRGIDVVQNATVYLEDCIVEGFQDHGIAGAGTVFDGDDPRQFALGVNARHNGGSGLSGGNWVIRKSNFENNSGGASVAESTIVGSRATRNDVGFVAGGINFNGSTVFDSVVEENGIGVLAPLPSVAILERTIVAGNGCGICMQGFDPYYYATSVIANSLFTGNTLGIGADDDFVIQNTSSLGNNTVSGNQTDVSGDMSGPPPL